MSQEAETLTLKPVQILSPEDSLVDPVRDPSERLEDWLNASDTSRNDTDQLAADPADVAAPPQPREIAFEGVLRINGYAAGVIRSTEGSLIVDPDGELDADISVNDATIYGCVRGDIQAKRKVELRGSARVVGDIETVDLSIEPGAVFEGRCIFVQASQAANDAESGLAATG